MLQELLLEISDLSGGSGEVSLFLHILFFVDFF